MSSTTDPTPKASSYTYWRSNLWLTAGCLGIGALVLALRVVSWPIADSETSPDELFSEWNDAQVFELGKTHSGSTETEVAELPPLPQIEFPADFPRAPDPAENQLISLDAAGASSPTLANFEATIDPENHPVWLAGTIESIDEMPAEPVPIRMESDQGEGRR